MTVADRLVEYLLTTVDADDEVLGPKLRLAQALQRKQRRRSLSRRDQRRLVDVMAFILQEIADRNGGGE